MNWIWSSIDRLNKNESNWAHALKSENSRSMNRSSIKNFIIIIHYYMIICCVRHIKLINQNSEQVFEQLKSDWLKQIFINNLGKIHKIFINSHFIHALHDSQWRMKLAKYKMKRFSTKNVTKNKIMTCSDRSDQKSDIKR